MPEIAIIGAGLIGRIIALECHLAGLSVSLFDRDNKAGTQSCAYTGAGMLAPYAELEISEPIIGALGIKSLALWPILLKNLPNVFFQQAGTLVLAHSQDQPELARFKRAVQFKLNSNEWSSLGINLPSNTIVDYNRSSLISAEEELPSHFNNGLFLPYEGQIDNRQLLDALKMALEHSSITWHCGIEIKSVKTNKIEFDSGKTKSFDFIIDCRGLGAKPDIKQLRGVRGELLLVEAPEVKLKRPIRLMHPRHPIYIVPRQNNRFIIGATSIESEDMRPITIQSSLELLSAACTVHPSFAEAIVLESRVNCRPTLPNNLPAIILSENASNIIRVNGLYRHGFLIAPKLAKLVLSYLKDGKIDQRYASLFHCLQDSSKSSNLPLNTGGARPCNYSLMVKKKRLPI